jgi:hypothetical protein
MAAFVPTPGARRWALVFDSLAALAFLVAAWVMFTGGLQPIEIYGIRFSVSYPQRATLAGFVLMAIRHRLDPRHPRLAGIWRRFDVLSDLGERQLFWPASRNRIGEFVLVTLGCTALVVLLNWKQISQPYGASDQGDPLFSMWRLSWISYQLGRNPAELFNGNIFHPEKLTLTYSDSILGLGLLAMPFIRLGVPIVIVYHLLFFAAFVFCGVTAYYLVRALTGRRESAVIGGVIFGLSAYRFEHYSHLEQVWTVFVPVTLLMLHRTLSSARWRHALATGVAYTLQMYTCMYAAVYLAIYMVPIAVILWVVRGRPTRPLIPLATGAVLAGALIWPLASKYLENRPTFGERTTFEIQAFSARGIDYLRPHPRNWLYGSHRGPERALERELFPGAVPIALAAVGFWPPVSTAQFGYAVAGLLAFDASLGLHGFTYPWLHDLAPFRGLRVPARFAALVGLTLAVLAGYGTARIVQRWPRRRVMLTIGLLTLVAIDVWPRLEVVPIWKSPPAIYSVIPEGPETVVADLPIRRGQQGEFFGVRYMYFSTFHWHTLIDGNSGWAPPSWWDYVEAMEEFPGDEAVQYLRSRGVRYIAVHGSFYEDPKQFDEIQFVLERRPDIERVSAARFNGSTSKLYRLRLPDR